MPIYILGFVALLITRFVLELMNSKKQWTSSNIRLILSLAAMMLTMALYSFCFIDDTYVIGFRGKIDRIEFVAFATLFGLTLVVVSGLLHLIWLMGKDKRTKKMTGTREKGDRRE